MAEEKTGGTPATKAKNKYNAKAYDQFLVTVPTGQKAEIDKEAKKQGIYSCSNRREESEGIKWMNC